MASKFATQLSELLAQLPKEKRLEAMKYAYSWLVSTPTSEPGKLILNRIKQYIKEIKDGKSK